MGRLACLPITISIIIIISCRRSAASICRQSADCLRSHGVAAALRGICHPHFLYIYHQRRRRRRRWRRRNPNPTSGSRLLSRSVLATVAIHNTRLLLEEMDVGGEVLCPPRGSCRNHRRYAIVLRQPQPGRTGRLFSGSTLCALSKRFCN